MYILAKSFWNSFSGSQAAFGTTFSVTSGYRKAGTKLLEGFSQLISDFIEASRNFNLDFFHKRTAKI
jgi:hypothetical protein